MTTVAIETQDIDTEDTGPQRRAMPSLSWSTLAVRALCIVVFAAVGLVADAVLTGVGAIPATSFGILTVGAVALQIGISVWAVALDLVAWPIFAITQSEDVSFIVGLAVGVAPALAGGIGFTSLFVTPGMIG